MATMTMKMFLEAVIATEGIAPELSEFAETQIVKLAEKAEKRKTSKAALAKAESDTELIHFMLDLMEHGKAVVSGEMAEKLAEAGMTADGGKPFSTSKVAAMFKKMTEMGLVTEGEGKAKGRKVKAFTKVETVDEGE